MATKRRNTNINVSASLYKKTLKFLLNLDLISLGEIQHDDFVWDTFNKIDKALLQIDFDVRACTQRSICWHVKNSLINIEENRARKIDTFVAGFIK